MTVLLLRLAGPLQSWGTQSRWGDRDTGLEPSKSGVVGLIACALGRARAESVSDLARLRFGIRVDKEGHFESDFHTVLDAARVPGKEADSKNAMMTNRRYLADADFLVGLEGDYELLQAIDAALRIPHWPLSLGRRAFAPSIPVAFPIRGPLSPPIREGDLEEVLPTVPRMAHYSDEPILKDLRMVIEVPLDQAYSIRQDQPVGAAFATREFAPRGVRQSLVPARDLMTVSL